MINTEVSPITTQRLAGLLLPVKPEEVLYPHIDESPIFRATQSFVGVFSLGTFIGAGAFLIQCVEDKSKPFSVGKMLKSGTSLGFRFGAEIALNEFFTTSFASLRGKECFYDRILAGAASGAILNCKGGWKSMGQGALNSALVSSAYVLLDSATSLIR